MKDVFYDPVEEAIRELDNFVRYDIDMGEKDHDKFFKERYFKAIEGLEEKNRELESQVEDLEEQLEDTIDEGDYYNIEEERDALKEMFETLKFRFKLTTLKGEPVEWKNFEAAYGYKE